MADKNEPDITIETKSGGEPIEKTPEKTGKRGDPIEELASSVKESAQKIAGSISKAIEKAMEGREFPLMVRVNSDSLKRIDELVEAGIFKSRSESAAFLISEGIKAQVELFERIQEKIREIERLRGELKFILRQDEPK
jgi:Arc/MetJ-type ribon-helix-helix transcriptional regulator